MTRRELDHYPTPKVAVHELLEELSPFIQPGAVIDPACGEGNLLLAAAEVLPPDRLATYVGYDINPLRVEEARARGVLALCRDYISFPVKEPPALFLCNPPYRLAQEFVTKMLNEQGMDTIVAVLLRLNFLGSQRRHEWWKEHAPDAVRVLSKRPSFTGDGHTDRTEYGWYIWGPDYWHHKIDALDWYCGDERAAA